MLTCELMQEGPWDGYSDGGLGWIGDGRSDRDNYSDDNDYDP